MIEGHTDDVKLVKASSREKYPRGNIELSVARALAVWEYLAKEGTLKPSRMTVVGYGPHRPRVPNDSESATGTGTGAWRFASRNRAAERPGPEGHDSPQPGRGSVVQ